MCFPQLIFCLLIWALSFLRETAASWSAVPLTVSAMQYALGKWLTDSAGGLLKAKETAELEAERE